MLQKQSNDQRFDDLVDEIITREYHSLVDYAAALLVAQGSREISISGKAEDVVQEAFAMAAVNQEKFLNSPEPVGWMYKAVSNKVHECLRADRTWRKHATQMAASCRREGKPPSLDKVRETISARDYYLLWKLHAEGYSYKEISEETGEKISALAMRAKRSKEAIRKKYKSLEDFLKDV